MSFICHIHNYTEYSQQWNVFSAFNPSKCTHLEQWVQPSLRRPGSSRGFGTLLKGLTLVMDNSCRSRDSNPQPQITKSNTLSTRPRLPHHEEFTTWNRTPISSTGGDSSTTAIHGWIWRDQRPFLHPESLQTILIPSSMTVLLRFSSPHSFSTGFRSMAIAEAWFCA